MSRPEKGPHVHSVDKSRPAIRRGATWLWESCSQPGTAALVDRRRRLIVGAPVRRAAAAPPPTRPAKRNRDREQCDDDSDAGAGTAWIGVNGRTRVALSHQRSERRAASDQRGGSPAGVGRGRIRDRTCLSPLSCHGSQFRIPSAAAILRRDSSPRRRQCWRQNPRSGGHSRTDVPSSPVDAAQAWPTEARRRNPGRYAAVAAAYPTLSRYRWREIVTHERLAADPTRWPQAGRSPRGGEPRDRDWMPILGLR